MDGETSLHPPTDCDVTVRIAKPEQQPAAIVRLQNQFFSRRNPNRHWFDRELKADRTGDSRRPGVHPSGVTGQSVFYSGFILSAQCRDLTLSFHALRPPFV
jgi:hypothetical protein